jgi:eukaryotic-like serine/threonine-protein kinase
MTGSSIPPRPSADETQLIRPLGPQDLSLTAAVGKYRFLGALGHGGMADVYLAMADGPEGFRKLCVVKMLKEEMANDEDFRSMFVDEARLAAQLNHPNIVQTYEVESLNGHLLLAMEYVEGATLSRLRRRMPRETFPLTASVRVVCDVLIALSYAHSHRDFEGQPLEIVHRDVSPHNIVVGYNGHVKLLDFGIAKSAAAVQTTQAGILKGKIGYMAPEQANLAYVDHRADLFSVGVILWESIANRRLASAKSAGESLARRIQGDEPTIESVVPGVDPELARIVGCATATAPGDRYASADAFLGDLEAWLSAQTEMPRRVWASHLAAAFDLERKKFQALAGQGGSDSRISVRTAASQRPHASSVTPSGAPRSDATSTSPAPYTFPGQSLSLVPATAPKSQWALAVAVVGGLAAVGLIVAALASPHSTRTSGSNSSAGGGAGSSHAPAAASVLPPAVPTTAPTTSASAKATAQEPAAALAATSSASPHRPQWGHGAPAHRAGTGTPTPTGNPQNSATKPSTRPLDERDPYAQ